MNNYLIVNAWYTLLTDESGRNAGAFARGADKTFSSILVCAKGAAVVEFDSAPVIIVDWSARFC